MVAIDVADVHKTFRGGVTALRGVTLSIAPGEIFGLLGQNGAGKTTLVKALLGVVSATAGRASVLGLPAGLVTLLDAAAIVALRCYLGGQLVRPGVGASRTR